MQFRKDQSGFSAVEAILILVITAILGFAGWFVWHSQKAADKTLSNTNSSSSPTYKSKSAVTNFEQCKAAKDSVVQETYPEQCITKDGKNFVDTPQQYLVIKEWSVKIPVSGDIADAYYYISPDNSSGAYLSLNSLKSTDCRADDISLAAISRITGTEVNQATGNTVLSEHPSAVRVGDYYYFTEYPQAGCDTSPARLDGVNYRNEFTSAIKQIQPE